MHAQGGGAHAGDACECNRVHVGGPHTCMWGGRVHVGGVQAHCILGVWTRFGNSVQKRLPITALGCSLLPYNIH